MDDNTREVITNVLIFLGILAVVALLTYTSQYAETIKLQIAQLACAVPQ